MPVVLVHQGPTLTQERYEEAVKKVTGGKSRLETPADWPVEGILMHVAGQGAAGFRVIDVWQSEEAVAAFGQILMPILHEFDVTDEPEMYPAHTFVAG